MKYRFILCGLIGWCLEIFWTGFHAFLSGERTMMGKTSLLMFPIYGCASIISPLYKKIAHLPVLFRGSLYTGGIFLVEFISGIFLKYFHMCPWDYSNTPSSVQGVIRLDYTPVWFVTGLIFEKILRNSS